MSEIDRQDQKNGVVSPRSDERRQNAITNSRNGQRNNFAQKNENFNYSQRENQPWRGNGYTNREQNFRPNQNQSNNAFRPNFNFNGQNPRPQNGWNRNTNSYFQNQVGWRNEWGRNQNQNPNYSTWQTQQPPNPSMYVNNYGRGNTYLGRGRGTYVDRNMNNGRGRGLPNYVQPAGNY